MKHIPVGIFIATLFLVMILDSSSLTIASSSSTSSSSLLSGIISSLVLDNHLFGNQSSINITNIQKFVLAGDWNIKLDSAGFNGSNSSTKSLKVRTLDADFIGITTDGKGPHTHQISNFKPGLITNDKEINTLSPDGEASIIGTVDVGISGQKVWENVRANITILEGRTIGISLNEEDVDYHFGKGQSIYGLVNRLDIG